MADTEIGYVPGSVLHAGLNGIRDDTVFHLEDTPGEPDTRTIVIQCHVAQGHPPAYASYPPVHIGNDGVLNKNISTASRSGNAFLNVILDDAIFHRDPAQCKPQDPQVLEGTAKADVGVFNHAFASDKIKDLIVTRPGQCLCSVVIGVASNVIMDGGNGNRGIQRSGKMDWITAPEKDFSSVGNFQDCPGQDNEAVVRVHKCRLGEMMDDATCKDMGFIQKSAPCLAGITDLRVGRDMKAGVRADNNTFPVAKSRFRI